MYFSDAGLALTIPWIAIYSVVVMCLWIGSGMFSLILLFIQDGIKFIPQTDNFPCGKKVQPAFVDWIERIVKKLDPTLKKIRKLKWISKFTDIVKKHEPLQALLIITTVIPLMWPLFFMVIFRVWGHRRRCLGCIMDGMKTNDK